MAPPPGGADDWHRLRIGVDAALKSEGGPSRAPFCFLTPAELVVAHPCLIGGQQLVWRPPSCPGRTCRLGASFVATDCLDPATVGGSAIAFVCVHMRFEREPPHLFPRKCPANDKGARPDGLTPCNWWVVLGSNQWPLPCEGRLALWPFSSFPL